MPEAALAAYRMHRGNALRRNIPFLFTLEQWWRWWSQDGRWERRGRHRGRDGLVMARKNDAGPYALGNVEPLTLAQNSGQTCRRKLGRASRAAWRRRNAAGNFGALAVQGEGHPSSRACITLLGRFGSARLAAGMLGVDYRELRRRLKRGAAGWRWPDEAGDG